jgi:methanethiol oxidase
MSEGRIVLGLLRGYKHRYLLHSWDLAKAVHKQAIDLSAEHQMVLELRPARDPGAS